MFQFVFHRLKFFFFSIDALKKLCDVDPKMMKGKVVANSKVFRNTKALENLDKHLEMLSI